MEKEGWKLRKRNLIKWKGTRRDNRERNKWYTNKRWKNKKTWKKVRQKIDVESEMNAYCSELQDKWNYLWENELMVERKDYFFIGTVWKIWLCVIITHNVQFLSAILLSYDNKRTRKCMDWLKEDFFWSCQVSMTTSARSRQCKTNTVFFINRCTVYRVAFTWTLPHLLRGTSGPMLILETA